MLSYFSEQLAGNASRGLINRVTDVRLLQGDLAEAWREGDTEYATVAMKFALKDSMVERASGRTVEGGEPSEVTELWTSCAPVAAIGCSQPSSRRDARRKSSPARTTLVCNAAKLRNLCQVGQSIRPLAFSVISIPRDLRYGIQ